MAYVISMGSSKFNAVLIYSLSPFAPTNEGRDADEDLESDASSGYHGNEVAAPGGVKGHMNLLDQVLHSDCKPVLEFSLVSISTS